MPVSAHNEKPGLTTLVIGAGAGVPYGFPTGDELKTMIQSSKNLQISPLTVIDDMFMLEVSALRQRLAGSGQESIDAWLAHNQALDAVGRICIAAELLPIEVNFVTRMAFATDWLAYVFRRIFQGPTTLGRQVRVVTFNYDHTWELAMLGMLQNSFGFDYEHAARVAKAVPIVHVYGELQSQAGLQALARLGSQTVFSQVVSHDIDAASRGIKIIPHKRPEDDPLLTQAKQLVQSADEVVFLGFGWDDVNMRRIGAHISDVNWTNKNRRVIGTAYKCGKQVIESAKNRLGVECQLESMDCLTLLKELSSLPT